MSEYDELYRENPAYFSQRPDDNLMRHVHLIPPASRVLDLGSGTGRNAIYVARRGHPVDAVDTSGVAVEILADAAKQENLPIHTHQADILQFVPPRLPYHAVLAFGIFQVLPRTAIETLAQRMIAWVAEGGLIFAHAFTCQDPSYAEIRDQWRPIGHNSFEGSDGQARTFLEADEILALFPGCEVIDHWEGLGPWHRHGRGPEERHGLTRLVACRAPLIGS